MTFEDLRCITEIAKQGSITKAATELNISQPTLSQRLKKVESELETELFDRSRFGQLTLTSSGVVFLRRSQEIMKSLLAMHHEIRNCDNSHYYRMGMPVRNGYNMVKGLTEALEVTNPEISIDYIDCNNATLEKKTASGEIDIALVRMTKPDENYRIFTIKHAVSVVRLRNNSPLWDNVYYREGDDVPYIDLMKLKGEPVCSMPSPYDNRSRLLSDMVLSQIPDFDFNSIIPLPNVQICEEYAKTGRASYICSDDTETEEGRICRLDADYSISYDFDLIAGPDMNIHDASIIADTLRKLRAQD